MDSVDSTLLYKCQGCSSLYGTPIAFPNLPTRTLCPGCASGYVAEARSLTTMTTGNPQQGPLT